MNSQKFAIAANIKQCYSLRTLVSPATSLKTDMVWLDEWETMYSKLDCRSCLIFRTNKLTLKLSHLAPKQMLKYFQVFIPLWRSRLSDRLHCSACLSKFKVRVSQKSTNITENMRQGKCKYSLTGNPGHIMEMLRDLYKRSHHIYITTHIHWRPQSICDAKEKAHMKIYPKYSFQPYTVQTWETNLAHWVCYVQHQQARGGIMRQPVEFENISLIHNAYL